MDFVTGLQTYFTIALDASMYVTFFFLTIGLVIFDWPEKYDTKSVLILLAKILGVYVGFVLFESFAFAFAMLFMPYGMFIYTASFCVIPIIYIAIFVKDTKIKKIIKMEIVVATVLNVGSIVDFLIDMVEQGTGGNLVLNVICRIFPYSILVFISYLLKKFDIGRLKTLTKSQIFLVSMTTFILVGTALWEANISTDSFSIMWLLIASDAGGLFVLVYMYYTMHSVMEKRHRITTLEVQSSILELEKDSLRIDQKNREELMKIRHDLKNQLSYVNALLIEQKNDEAQQYLKGLLEQKEEYLESFSCSNTVISGIVNLELTKAKIEGKKIKFRAVVPPRLPFEDSDLLSLITNVADNCIENFVPENDNDQILISILTQNDYLRIVSFNTVDVEKATKKFLSTTKSGKDHGYGTKIIKNITDKYHGYSTFKIENNKFICDVVLDMSYRSYQK